MIDILGKIAVGKNKFDNTLHPQQEGILKLTALETFTSIVTTQVAWLEKQIVSNKTENPEDDESTSDIGSDTTLIEFEKNKLLKASIGKAVTKFNIKPVIGIKYLAESGHITSGNHKEIASFLKFTPGIDKTILGEFFGGNKEPNISIFNEFVQLFQFENLGIVEAIREFLLSFRLPGEGQVVDRIMQKFAEKYFKDNPEHFEEADTVYVLSFAIIMLQTDLHNDSIQKKMPLAQFQIMNSGINKGKDLDPHYLEEIYNTVKNNKFTLEEDEEAREKLESAGKKKQQLFVRESEKMLQKGQKLIKESKRTSTYYTAQHIDHLKTMLEVLWHPLLATFSIILEEATDPKFWKLSLQGFSSCIRIACRFSMTLELEIFLSSLAKFTSLIYLHNQISEKNIECMKALLEVAKFESNFLKGSWLHILRCLSKLDHLHLISSGVQFDGPVTENDIINSESVSLQITPAEIDYIFNMSATLDNDTIIEFVTRLIEVSQDELWGPHPRTFCLQALVNVADVNMNRMRYVWSRVWKTLRDHFSQAGLHKNQFVASFAIDSLKQLAIKFLQKEELENFHFQKDFLQPFEVIMKNSEIISIKELVVACMSTFVFTVGHNIKSGWGTIIEVLVCATKEQSPCIHEQAFAALKKIVEKYLQKVQDFHSQITNILMVFAEGNLESVASKSLEVLSKAILEFLQMEKGPWKPLLLVLAKATKEPRPAVRGPAPSVLYSTLNQGKFSENQLKEVFKEIISPLFEDFKGETDKDWISSTFTMSLSGLSSLISEKFDLLQDIVPSFIQIIQTSVLSMNENLAKVALAVYKGFISLNYPKLSKGLWDVFVVSTIKVVESATPDELFQEIVNNKLPFDPRHISDKILILHHFLLCMKELINCELEKDVTEKCIKIFYSVYDFARKFNSNHLLRKALWHAGFMAGNKTLPGLFRLEKEALIIVLELIHKGNEQSQIYLIAKDLLADVSQKDKFFNERKEEIASLEQVVAKNLLPNLAERVEDAMKFVGEEIVELVTVPDLSIRDELKKLLRCSLKVFKNG
jgi:brefeldin A-inhibited guanine nucleotide-exchange protein